jgi:hypothetical protein
LESVCVSRIKSKEKEKNDEKQHPFISSEYYFHFFV